MYQKACAGGAAAGCYELALLHEVGNGVARDHSKAVAFLQQACTAGIKDACAKLKGR
jgi:TPR repeat protein